MRFDIKRTTEYCFKQANKTNNVTILPAVPRVKLSTVCPPLEYQGIGVRKKVAHPDLPLYLFIFTSLFYVYL
jgi:hypothetical protein